MEKERIIFITGFPGFIADRLVQRLAAADVHFCLLVESRWVDKAKERAVNIAEQTNVPVANFEIIAGDITDPHLALTSEQLGSLRERVTDVFHLAAAYDLAIPRETAFRVNLDGTKNVNNFVRGLGRLIRYNYVSTCYVAGKRRGIIFESELQHNAGFRNFYEESKYLAEAEVERLKSDLPVAIFRPSVVVGDSQTGRTAKYDGIYHLILYLLKAPNLLRIVNVGNDDVMLNLVPVDFVIEGMAALGFDDAVTGKTIALADPNPLTTREIFDVIATTLTGKQSVIAPPAAIVETFLNLPISPLLTGLPNVGVPYFFLHQIYDTYVAAPVLRSHDIFCPNFREYAPKIADFVGEHPHLAS